MSQTIRGVRFGGHQSFSAGAVMSDDDLRRAAPAIFAEAPHASRSARYAYIPTTDVLAGLRAEGFQPVRAIQGKCRTEGKEEFTKHMIRFRHPDFGMQAKLGGVAPEVVLINSHDGTTAYRLLAGVFRSICTNSMIVMEDGAADIHVPHKGDVVHDVIDASFSVIGHSRLTLDRAEEWAGITLEHEECLALADAARTLRFGDADGEVETPIEAKHLLRARRTEDRGNNLWLTHNVVQENVIKGGLHAWGRDANNRARRVTTREVKNIDGDVKLNRALWLLTERMAQIKTGQRIAA